METKTITVRANTIAEAIEGPRKVTGPHTTYLYGRTRFDFVLDEERGVIYHARSGTPVMSLKGTPDDGVTPEGRMFIALSSLVEKAPETEIEKEFSGAPVINYAFRY